MAKRDFVTHEKYGSNRGAVTGWGPGSRSDWKRDRSSACDPQSPRHMRDMAQASYRVIWRGVSGYAVEVTEPNTRPRVVSGFHGESEAKAWIAEQKWSAAISLGRDRTRPSNG